MKIDAHQHFWYYKPDRDQWIDDSMAVLKKDFLPADLKPLLEENNFDGCIAVQADQSEDETSFLLKLADENDFIKGVVGWVDLRNLRIEERLNHFAGHKKLKGFRHIVQAEPDDFMLKDDFQRGIKALGEHGFTYDVLIYPSQLPAAIELVNFFPDQPFVLDHMGKPEIKNQYLGLWKEQISILAQAPNVYCKISGLVTEAAWHSWERKDFTLYLDEVFDAFGTDRLMVGSDWPVCLLSASYLQAISIVNEYIGQFSASEKAKVMGENAHRFYKISV